MTKNTLTELNNSLFDQMARLSAGDLSDENLEKEVKRANAIVAVADKITSNADLQLKAAKLFAEHRDAVLPYLPQIGNSTK